MFFSRGGFNKLPIPHKDPTIMNEITTIAMMLSNNYSLYYSHSTNKYLQEVDTDGSISD